MHGINPSFITISLSPRHGLPSAAPAVALLLLMPAGCKEPATDADEAYVREGKVPDQEPIPGGTNCRGCAWATPGPPEDPQVLKLCVRNDAKYLGSEKGAHDDIPLASLFKGSVHAVWKASWQDPAVKEKSWDGCDPCSVKQTVGDAPHFKQTLFTVPVESDPTTTIPGDANGEKSFQITFSEIDDVAFMGSSADFPSMIVSLRDHDNFECDTEDVDWLPTKPKASPPPSDPVIQHLAHIVYESESGGMRTCSGTVIGDKQVLTAAHCFWERPAQLSDVSVVVGAWYPMIQGKPVGVAKIMVHDAYRYGLEGMERNSAEHDLAILTLTSAVIEAPVPFTVPKTLNEASKLPCNVLHGYGFGAREERSDPSPYYDHGWFRDMPLKEAPELNDCSATSPTACVDKSRVLPIVASYTAKELCLGDSGGPIFAVCDENRFLVAVAAGRVPENADGLKFGVPNNLGPPMGAPGHNGIIEIEALRAAVSFNHGNDCGIRPADGFIAAYVDLGAINTNRMSLMIEKAALKNMKK